MFAMLLTGCDIGRRPLKVVQQPSPTPKAPSHSIAELWVEPEPGRNLFFGVGGPGLSPSPSATYTVIKNKKGGFSDGYTVRDQHGREWSAKLYPEARTEVVASRILWGLGYHQPPIYTMEEWWAEGARSENPQPVARFREEKPAFHGLTELQPWSYAENPFVGSRPLAGLIVLQVMLCNSDLKPENNMLYALEENAEGARRWFVARDLGQTFGRTGILGARRDDAEAYQRTRFITGVQNGIVKFEYWGRNAELLKGITPEDVRWISQRLSKLTDKQYLDAFRAGGYAEPTARRYLHQLKSKIAEGLAIEG
jgi:hypothetical protein